MVLLHRPSIEALLAPRTSLEVLGTVTHGYAGLKWCAETEVELGSWGIRARAMLRESNNQSSEEDAASVSQQLEDASATGFVTEEISQDIGPPADIAEPDGEVGPSAIPLDQYSPDPLSIFRVGCTPVSKSIVAEHRMPLKNMLRVEESVQLPNDINAISEIEASSLRQEVSDLGAELGSLEEELEAELEAELLALEYESEDCEPEEEPRKDVDVDGPGQRGPQNLVVPDRVDMGVGCSADESIPEPLSPVHLLGLLD